MSDIISHLGFSATLIETGTQFEGEIMDDIRETLFSGKSREEATGNFNAIIEKHFKEKPLRDGLREA